MAQVEVSAETRVRIMPRDTGASCRHKVVHGQREMSFQEFELDAGERSVSETSRSFAYSCPQVCHRTNVASIRPAR